MLRRIYFILFLCTVQVFPRVYTLDELVELAESNSLDLRSAKMEIDKTEDVLQQLYSTLFPSVSFYAQGNHVLNDAALPYLFAPEANGWSTYLSRTASVRQSDDLLWAPEVYTDVAERRSISSLSGAFVLRQELLKPLKTLTEIHVQRSRQGIAVCRYESARRGVRTSTMKCYYRLLLAQFQLTHSKEQVSLSQERHRLYRSDFVLGTIPEIDTLESAQALEESGLSHEAAEVNRKNVAEELARICRIPESPVTLWVEGSFPEPVFFITIDEALVALRENNNAIRQFKGEENVLKESVSREKMRFLPEVYVGAAAGRIYWFDGAGTPSLRKGIDDRRVFAGIQWNLFSGFGTSHTIALAKKNLEQRLFLQQQLADELETDVRKRFEDILHRKKALDVTLASVKIAEKKTAIGRMLFANGECRQFDVLLREADVREKQMKYLEQLCMFHVALAEFRQIIGSQ